jgi:hypothetical protein
VIFFLKSSLEKYVARNAFQIVTDTVDFTFSRDRMVSPREAVRLLSHGNGQGFIYCECKTGTCKTRRCKCFAGNLHCKSKCHSAVNTNRINKCKMELFELINLFIICTVTSKSVTSLHIS